jgi:predicted LPLAT superfamily acyltransferase
MLSLFYRSLVFLSRVFGPWVFESIAQGIAAGYFLLSPCRVMASVRFYQALFPQRRRAYHLWCTWRQYQNFTSVYLDRFLFKQVSDITFTSSGWENLENALDQNTGGIILMSHLGNWEIAAHVMKRKREQVRLILFMGMRAKAEIERIQKEDLQKRGIRIVAAEKEGGAPFDLLEGLRFIESGGLVSMTGDKIWNPRQRVVAVSFLGHEVNLPETPHLLAMLSGAPLFLFFSCRTGNRRYHNSLSAPIYIEKASRRNRTEAIRRSAQNYADLLEKNLREHPLEWYHFEQFLGPQLK